MFAEGFRQYRHNLITLVAACPSRIIAQAVADALVTRVFFFLGRLEGVRVSALRTVITSVAFVSITTACSHTSGPTAAAVAMQHSAIRVAIDVGDIAPSRGTGVVFVDAMKQAEAWSSRGPLVLDQAGNVRFLAPGQIAETIVYRSGGYPAGNYTLLFSGKGTFDFNGTGATPISRVPGRIVLRIAPRSSGLRLRLTASDPLQPVRDIRLILPGFQRSYASAPFHPLFVRELHAFHVLCFKEWMHGATFVSGAVWPSRPTTWRATQVSPAGVAPEYMVALANATGADPWFTLPVGATNMYIYQFAALVHQTLDPRLHATFEYGHEVWKPGTPGNAYAQMAGRNLHLAADPSAAAQDWYALRSAQMFTLVERAFGADAGRADEVLKGAVAAAPPRPLSRDALERSLVATQSAGYMPPLPTPLPAAAPAPPLPLAANCRSPQCARLPPEDRTPQRVSPGLAAQRQRQTMTDTSVSPPDYRT
jgi:hypothetical protein